MLYDSSSSSNQPSFYISVCPFTDSAIFWAVCPSFPVLLLATSTHFFNMAFMIVNCQGAIADTSHSPNSGNCSRLLRSAVGCGAMGGGSQES